MSGVVYFSVKIAEKLLMSPLNACTTYLGLDSGARPTKVSQKLKLKTRNYSAKLTVTRLTVDGSKGHTFHIPCSKVS